MSRTGRERLVPSDSDDPGPRLSTTGRWLTVVAVPLLGALTILDQTPVHSSIVLIIAAAVSYLLAFAVVMAVATLARTGAWVTLLLAAVLGIFATVALSHGQTRGSLALAPVLIPALVVGLVARSRSRSAAFWTGALLLVGIMIARDLAAWQANMALLNDAAPLLTRDIAERLRAVGLDGSFTETTWTDRIQTLSWYLPGLLTCSALVPFSVGSLWFFTRTARVTGQSPAGEFVRWKLPRFTLLIALFAGLGRQLGETTMRQISDNVLLALAVAFAIVGTAGLEYLFRRRAWPIWVRLVVYLILIVTHVYGLLVLIAVGVLDTLLGWRSASGARKAGKESVS